MFKISMTCSLWKPAFGRENIRSLKSWDLREKEQMQTSYRLCSKRSNCNRHRQNHISTLNCGRCGVCIFLYPDFRIDQSTRLHLQGKVARSAVLTTKGQIHLMRAKFLSWRISENFWKVIRSDPFEARQAPELADFWTFSIKLIKNVIKKDPFWCAPSAWVGGFSDFSCRLEPKNNSFWSAPSTWIGGLCEKCPNCRNVGRRRRRRRRRRSTY